MEPIQNITFVTSNQKKVDEVKSILKGVQISMLSKEQTIELPEIQDTIEEISKNKCLYAVNKIQRPCIVEDTGLYFNALNGLPGPYIKHFLDGCKNEGLWKMLQAFDDKSAYAVCAVSFTIGPDQPVHTFVGISQGKIVEPRGPTSFGWDPIFEPKEFPGKTFAEMTSSDKNRFSHCRRAFDKLKQFLFDNKLVQ